MAIVLTEEDTLSAESESLRKESSILTMIQYGELAAGVLLVLWGLAYWFLYEGFGWLIFGGIMLFLAVSHYVKSKQNIADAARFDYGKSGEEFATEILENDLPDNCLILNDLQAEPRNRPAQMDHVVVTPAGLFVIETKAYSGTLQGHANDEKWTQIKEYNGNRKKNMLTNPIQQNKYHIEVLLNFIRDNDLAFAEEDVHNYVAMVNKYHTLEVDGDTSVINFAWVLPKKINPQLQQIKYSEEEIAEFLAEFNLTLPDEFEMKPGKQKKNRKQTPGKSKKKQDSRQSKDSKSKELDLEDLKM